MGQICQRRAQVEAPSAAPPTQTLMPKKHDPKRYATDYSRFDQIDDSDEEVKETKPEEQELPEEEPSEQNPSDTQRRDLKEKFMKISRKMLRDTTAHLRDDAPEEKPKAANLPKDHKKPVGTISVTDLAKYSCSNDRMLVSCYGDIFDVSSRPDVYGWGPKSWQSGKDITWLTVTGNEKPDQCNRFYDLFKLDPNHISRYLTLICNRLLALENEFGKPVGRLEKFEYERYLPAAPQNEVEECKQQ